MKQNSKEADMPQIVTSTVVATPVGEVWALLRDFAAIGDDAGGRRRWRTG